jgi:hypothetical protein
VAGWASSISSNNNPDFNVLSFRMDIFNGSNDQETSAEVLVAPAGPAYQPVMNQSGIIRILVDLKMYFNHLFSLALGGNICIYDECQSINKTGFQLIMQQKSTVEAVRIGARSFNVMNRPLCLHEVFFWCPQLFAQNCTRLPPERNKCTCPCFLVFCLPEEVVSDPGDLSQLGRWCVLRVTGSLGAVKGGVVCARMT